MAIFPRFFGKQTRAKGPEDDFWYYPVGSPTKTGIRVDEKQALKYLTLFSCVSLIAGDIARLPLQMFRRRADGGKDAITDHRLYDILHNAPNPDTTSYNFREALQGHLLTWGNCYAYIERDRRDGVAALWQLPDPGKIKVSRRGSQIVYTYKSGNEEVTRTRREIFHIPGYGFNGLVGLSMVSIAQEAIGLGLSTEEYGALFFGQGTQPSGTIEMEGTLGESRDIYLKALKEGYEGLGKAHKVMVLEHGMKYRPINIPINDAQFLETRSFQKTEICGMFHVPPHKIAQHGQNSNYNNLEQENASYVDSCLMHWVVRWESAISQQLLTEKERRSGLFFEFNVNGLLRGDSQARAEYYNKVFQVGGMTPNEIRSKENLNPIDGGDQPFVMLNMVPLNKSAELIDKQLEDEPEPTEPPEGEITDREFFTRAAAKRKTFDIATYQRGLTRIRKQFRVLIADAAQIVVNREAKAVRAAVRKELRSKERFSEWLDKFYETHGDFVGQKLGPILRTYQQQVADYAGGAIGAGAVDLDDFVDSVIRSYVIAHVRSSSGQIKKLIEEIDLDDLADAVDTRMEEWIAKRPGKIARDSVSRYSNAAAMQAWRVSGVTKKQWQTVGDNCPFCTGMNGRIVGIDRTYLPAGATMYAGQGWVDIIAEDGTEIVKEKPGVGEEEGVQALKSFGDKMHPPIHRGCDCIIVPVL